MDQYKKKSFKFNNLQVCREVRHAETVKARESSRFKRLSMLRSIDEEEKYESFEKTKSQEEVSLQKPVSRLEMLRKWKFEKTVKKELEKKNTVRPFYAGSSSLKNASKKPVSMPISAKFNNKDLGVKSIPAVGNNFKTNGILPKTKIQTSIAAPPSSKAKEIAAKGIQSRTIPSTTVAKETSYKGIPSRLGCIPRSAKCNNKDLGVKSIPAVGNNVKTNGILPKPKIQTGIAAPLSSKAKEIAAKGIQSRTIPSAPMVKEIPSKGIPSRIGKPISSLPKRMQTQSKMPVSAGSTKPIPGQYKKPGPVSKIDEKKTLHSKENLKYGKKIPNEVTDKKKLISSLNEVKKTVDEKCKDELLPDQKTADIPQIFDCDISIIKPASSFAPADFKFVPPADLFEFQFDDAALNRIKELVSRTSTPSKPCQKSPVQDYDGLSTPKLHEKSPVQNIDYLNEPSCNNGLVVCEEVSLDPSKPQIIQEEENINTVSSEQLKKSITEEKFTQESDIQLVSDENLPTERTYKSPSFSGAVSFDSSSDTVDLRKIKDTSKDIMLIKFEDEELQKGVASEEQESESKLLSAFPKRPSMLKRVSVLNSIAEIDECLTSPGKSTKNKENIFMGSPRRSLRLSKLLSIDESPSSVSTVTPRRSMRLHAKVSKRIQLKESFISKNDSAFGDTSSPKLIPLKDLKTRNGSHTNITADFDKLTLEEFDNMNPEDFLFDIDDSPEKKIKAKKISLLYSPEKRKSVRRSIRGDLICFSPVNHI